MKSATEFTAWLEEKLRTTPPGSRLPTDRQFAATFGLSPTTVRRVLKRFRDGGRVVRVSGKGTFVPEQRQPVSAPEAPRSSAENVLQHLTEAILGGQLRRGQPLPPPKQLVHGFGVSPGTVRAAYETLRRQGHVTRVGRRYWVGHLKDRLSPEARKEVYLFRHGAADFAAVFRDGMLAQAYQKLERELVAHGYYLLSAPASEFRGLLDTWRRRRTAPYGFIFSDTDEQKFEPVRPFVPRLLALCEQVGHDRTGILLDWGMGIPPRRPRGILVLSRGNVLTQVARELARFLHGKGHRTALFFGQPAAVVWLGKVRAELKRLDAQFAFRFVIPAPAGDTDAAQALTDQVRRIVAGSPAIGPIVGKYQAVAPEVLLDETFVVASYQEARERFPDARLWVVQKDAAAAAALDWAAQAGIRIPDELGLVSCENDPAFYHLGLTCCYPDHEQIGHQMAHAIIGDFRIARSSKGYLRVGALLVEKLTT